MNTSFSRNLIKDIVIVGDNDDDPERNLEALFNQIEEAGFVNPAAPNIRSTGTPAITVIMLPLEGQKGNLESYCLEAAHSADARVASDVRVFSAQQRSERWSPSRRGKMELRVSLAARCERDPFVFLGRAFNDFPNLIPLSDPSFDNLYNILNSIP